MTDPVEPVHILRHYEVTGDDGFNPVLSRRHDVEPGTWCGLPMPKKNYTTEGSAKAHGKTACPACVEALNKDLASRPPPAAATDREDWRDPEEELYRGFQECVAGKHKEEKLTSNVVWCSRCGSVSVGGGAYRAPEHLEADS